MSMDLGDAGRFAHQVGSTDTAVDRIYGILRDAITSGWDVRYDLTTVTFTKPDDRHVTVEFTRRGEVRRVTTPDWQLIPKDTDKAAALATELRSVLPSPPPANAQRRVALDDLRPGMFILRSLSDRPPFAWHEILSISPRRGDRRSVVLKPVIRGTELHTQLADLADGYVTRLHMPG